MSRRAAVHNNATWCDAVCRALGHTTIWQDGLWMDLDAAPPYYPSAVTTAPDAQAPQRRQVRAMLASPLPRPWTIKDGFHALDLATDGFDILFAAEWLTLPGTADALVDDGPSRRRLVWEAIMTDGDLAAWERTWTGANPDVAAVHMPRLFGPALLGDPSIRFLAGWDGAIIRCVAAANRSDDGSGPVVGISNVVLGGDDPERHRAAAVQAVRDSFPGLPLVGYERGADLRAMCALGFETLGPLRVWITR